MDAMSDVYIMLMWLTSYHHYHYSVVFICSHPSLFVIQGNKYCRFLSKASIIVMPHLPQVGHRWGLVGDLQALFTKIPTPRDDFNKK